jgi:hypothetical protein
MAKTYANEHPKYKKKDNKKAVKVAEASSLDSTAIGMFGVPYDQLGPLQIIAVDAAVGKTG